MRIPLFFGKLRNEVRFKNLRSGDMQTPIHFSSSFMGYNKFQVNQILSEKDREIAVLKEELAKVQENLKQYIEMEEALKEGIVDARMTGKKIILESKEESDLILRRTNEQVLQFKEEFSIQSHDLIESGNEVKKQLNQMKNEMLGILLRYQEMLTVTDFDELYPENQLSRFKTQLFEYDQTELGEPLSPNRAWETQTMTEEEKKALELLIHEVIANEKDEALTEPKKV